MHSITLVTFSARAAILLVSIIGMLDRCQLEQLFSSSTFPFVSQEKVADTDPRRVASISIREVNCLDKFQSRVHQVFLDDRRNV